LQREKEVPSEEKKSEQVKQPHVYNVQKKRLSYKEQREFEMLEKDLSDLEAEKKAISEKLSSTETSFDELQYLSKRIGEISHLIDQKELRWLELSE
jgi:ATP-binding cassette subfamily F protein uup